MNLKITLIVLINFTLTVSYGQYDWTHGTLVFKNGDTIRGEIKLPMISKDIVAFNGEEKIKFRRDRESEKIKYDESQIDKVIFKNSDTEVAFFEYVKLSENKKGLFKIITKGKATLYARSVSISSGTYINGVAMGGGSGMWSYSYSDFNEFYILRENEIIASPLITARISRSFKKRAVDYFNDCPTLVSKLEESTLRKEDIREVVSFYNKCH